MTNRERALTRLDIRKIQSDGRYVDFENSIITRLTYDDIIFLRTYHGNRNIASQFEFSTVRPLNDSRLKTQGQKRPVQQTRRPATNPSTKKAPTKQYALTREQKGKKHKGIKFNGRRMVAAIGVVILSLSIMHAMSKGPTGPINIEQPTIGIEQEYDVAGGGFTDPTTTTDETLSVTPEEDIEEISEERQIINVLADIYHIDRDKAYDIIAEMTDDFTSDSYVKDHSIKDVSCKGSGQLYCQSDEEVLLYTMRILKQDPERFGYTYEQLKANPDFKSSTNYSETIAHYANVLGVDPALIHGIIQAETGFDSELFNQSNNPAGLKKNNGNWWVFDTKEEGIIELMLEVLKYQRMGADTIEEIAEIHCPIDDPDDHSKINQYWVDNVTEATEYAKDIYKNMQIGNGSNRL